MTLRVPPPVISFSLEEKLEIARQSLEWAEKHFERVQAERQKRDAGVPFMHRPADAALTVEPVRLIIELRQTVADLENQIKERCL